MVIQILDRVKRIKCLIKILGANVSDITNVLT